MTALIFHFPEPRAPLAPPPFVRFLDAVRFYRGRPDAAAELRAAKSPPVDGCGDVVYDAALSVIFRNVVGARDQREAVLLIQSAFTFSQRTREIYSANKAEDPTAPLAVERLDALLLVLERWRGQVAEEGLLP